MFAVFRFCSSLAPALNLVFLVASATPAAQGAEGHPYALLIAVNTYDNVKTIKRDQNPSFAERDAQLLAETFRGRGVAADSVVAMTTAASRNDGRFPTAAKIRKQVKAIAALLRDSNTIVVSFAGCELRFTGDDDYYLCPADADADDPHTLVSLREFCTVLGQTKGEGKLVIVDPCRLMEGEGTGKAPAPRIPARSVGILFACSAGQNAYEVAEKRQGILSFFVADGPRGAADIDRDGTVTSAELVTYVKARVPNFQKDQQAELIGHVPQTEFTAAR